MKKSFSVGMLLLIVILIQARTANQPEYYSRWTNIPSKELIKMGSMYGELQKHPDSALICYTIVTSRYDTNLDKAEKRNCMMAFIGRWYHYFFNYFDYSKAYENLAMAQEIAKDIGYGTQRVLLNFGCMYQTIYEQSGDLKSGQMAFDYYRKAFRIAIALKETSTLDMSVANLITMANSMQRMDSIGKEITEYRKLTRKDSRKLFRYNLLMYNGLLCMERREFQQALLYFDQQTMLFPKEEIQHIRYIYVTQTNKAKAYAAMGNYQEAVEMMEEAQRIAYKYDMKDARLECYRLLADYYHKVGQKEQEINSRNLYFSLKDTLLNYQQMASVSELRFLNEMKKMDDQIAEMSHKRQVQNMITWGVVGVSIIVLLLLFIVWKKNTTLKKTNKSLYQKNVSMLQREEEERQRWKVYEHQLEELKSIANVPTQSKPEEKYKASQLSEVDMDELANNILAVMETSEEIFSFDFSRERLAEIVMSKPKYVSQVINERFRCNFNVFINDYRIKEACRRINDFNKYGSMTIEAIANSVGFKSRTSFVNSFKMFTGLMPSEYLRLAKESKI